MTENTIRRHLGVAASALGLAGVLVACGGSGPATTTTSGAAASTTGTAPSTTTGAATAKPSSYPPVTPGPAATGAHNDADVKFATDMIPHHGQAVVMSDLILAHSQNAQVKSLATAIKNAQGPEIATMSGWLKGWGATPADPYEHAMGMPDGGHAGHGGMAGMMTQEQMREFAAARGALADKAFLTMMIEHHQGAVEMAKTELAKGANPQAKALAQQIISSPQSEIEQMKKLLTSIGQQAT